MHYPDPHCDESNLSKVENHLSTPQREQIKLSINENSLSVFEICIIRVPIATENILFRIENQISPIRGGKLYIYKNHYPHYPP